MPPTRLSLPELLALSRDEATAARARFHAPTQPRDQHSMYGGQLLGQSVMAASATVGDDRAVHSLHASFLRGGDMEAGVDYEVEALQDGGSFSRRQVRAHQGERLVFTALASFHVDEPGPEHRVLAPLGEIPDPESLPAEPEHAHRITGSDLGVDIRRVPATPRDDEAVELGRMLHWVRVLGPVPDDRAFRRAAVAYASDLGLFVAVLRRHGLEDSTRPMVVTSLDHSIWWHADAPVDEWLLYVQESRQSGAGRGLAGGSVLTRSGELVATIAQEGMLRLRD